MKTFSAFLFNWRGGVVGGAVLVAVTATVATVARSVERSALDSRAVFETLHGPLTISVGVSGMIKALDQEIIRNEVEGQTTILSIIPEGRDVEEGELLVELDASRIQDQLVDQEIAAKNAEASFIHARENLEVVRNQAQSDVDRAELVYRFAKEDLQKFKDGDYPLQLKGADAKLTLAQGDLKRAQDKVEGSRRLAERDFITPMELEADEQAAVKAQLDLQMAQEQLKLLREFEYTRQLAQLESDEEQARMALERVQRKAAADVVQAEAELTAKQLASEREKGKLEKLREQLKKTKIYAPRAGLVVYATTGRGGWHGSEEPLAEGQTVRERQELIYLPTTDSYKAEVKVHESSLAKVKSGLPATLTVDALPGHTFQGQVEFISPLPDAQSVWMNPDLKVYNTDIRIQGSTEGLRTGMSCRGEILVKEIEDTVYVPVQSVVRESGVPTVYVVEGTKVERRKVALGLDNNRMVQIADGLTVGELVMLAPPLAADEIEARSASSRQNGASATRPSEQEATKAPATSPGTLPEQPSSAERAEPAGAGGDDLRARFRNASPEERERMRQEWQQRLQNMTPEERERIRERMQRSRGEGPPEGSGRQE